MKNCFSILVAIILLLSCGTPSGEPANTDSKTAPAKVNLRKIRGNTLKSNYLPEIEIKVSDPFKYIGKFDFEIIANSNEYPDSLQGKPVAEGYRYVYAVWDRTNKIEKLFIVQFEGFLPKNDFVYNYDFSNAEPIGENKYRHNTWFHNNKQSAIENPTGESAKTRKFLEDKGLVLEDEFMMSRFVGLASEDRKNEIILFYMEMLNKTTGYSLEEYENSIPKEEAKAIEEEFVKRSRASFTIVKG